MASKTPYLSAAGERLLFTWCVSSRRYLSSLQVKECWPELGQDDTVIDAKDAQGRVLQFTVGHTIQQALTRNQTQHRIVLYDINIAEFRKAGADIGSVVAFSRTSDGTYHFEVDTPQAKTCFDAFRPARFSGTTTTTTATTATTSLAAHSSGTKQQNSKKTAKRGPGRPKKQGGASGSGSGGTKFSRGGGSKEGGSRGGGGSGMSTDEDYSEDEDDLLLSKAKRLHTGLYRKGARVAFDTSGLQGGKKIVDDSPMVGLNKFIQAPMRRLPGEEPLGLEAAATLTDGGGTAAAGGGISGTADGTADGTAAGGSRAARGGRAAQGAPASASAAAAAVYRAAVDSARKRMQERAKKIGKEQDIPHLPKRALSACLAFEKICLEAGQPGTSAEERMAVCIEYDTVLRLVYPERVLDPHFLHVKALESFEGTEDLQLLRCMERRFIIWRQGDDIEEGEDKGERGKQGVKNGAASAGGGGGTGGSLDNHRPGSGGDQGQSEAAAGRGHKNKKQKTSMEMAKSIFAGAVAKFSGRGSGSGELKEETLAPPSLLLSTWVTGLAEIWKEFSSRLRGKVYGGIDLQTTENRVSCALHDTLWRNGRLARCPVPGSVEVLAAVDESKHGQRPGRLYLTDGSMPDYEAHSYPRAAPGMPCSVDAATNAMLPHGMRSSRASNLFHFLKNESTGTGTFTLFLPVGGGCNLTAFHYETKRRRSYNCGSGDYIVQPLAVADNVRALMRVHAAVAGQHTRHGQLLPLECYLEEGITMVTHVRRSGEAPTMCELCEQSMHAFLSFADATSIPPPLKVSCNDFDLLWEVNSAYFLELVAAAYKSAGCMPEEGMPPDGADTWIQSSYLLAEPRTVAALEQNGPVRPWLCEGTLRCHSSAGTNSDASLKTQGGEIKGGEFKDYGGLGGQAGEQQGDAVDEELEEVEDSELHWGMDVVVVRTVEKLLDVLQGALTQENVAPWAGEVPSLQQAGEALRNLVPVLAHMHSRAAIEKEADGSSGIASGGGGGEEWLLDCHFSSEYMEKLLTAVKHELDSRDISYTESVHCPVGPITGGGTKQQGGLSLNLRPSELRALWIETLHKEWRAVSARPIDLERIAEARRERSGVEKAWDTACCFLAEVKSEDWGVLGKSEVAEEGEASEDFAC